METTQIVENVVAKGFHSAMITSVKDGTKET
jgi:hypothetical protein